MQWKSFVFILATVESALARSHGHHKHRHGLRHAHQVADLHSRALDSAALGLNGLVDLEPITVTATVWECCTAAPSTSSVPPPEIPVATSEPPVETPSSAPEPQPEPVTSSAPEVPSPSEVPEPVIITPSVVATSTAEPSSTTEPATSAPTGSSDWTSVPENGEFCYDGFGGRTASRNTDSRILYTGNVGIPWGSNMLEVSESEAARYKYVVQFNGSKKDKWKVVVWNKIGPDGGMTGWYGNSAVEFSIGAGETRYVAFDENTQGSWGAAKGDSLPTDEYGGYSCTWGEFDFGNENNGGWSGWDVSAIQAQAAKQHVQGMKICSHRNDNCSIITTGAAKVIDAYEFKDAEIDGIGGKVVPGPVRVVTHLDYDE